ncbi:putative NmrA family transcriptional regulator [Paraphoma chrysanthemicola]|uniref:NmrA-like family domain-containing protein 1 n=1 Tax=Paraphoma chrysanthemicola TaxID=798071 RepID=A0A8K0RF27_9PLEO|nr:putative NmrA family transcriptional regulator [Paraphoma chrysanthemicola]
MSKIITVFGATGNQGGSVIKQLLNDSKLSQEFKIRGVTRDSSKPAAQELAKLGVEVVVADLSSKESLQAALQGSHTVFLVTNYWETANPAIELSQGKNVADVSKEVGVQHLIFSSLLNVTETSGGRLTHVPHFDGKSDIEQYIRDLGVPATFYLPGYFMSNLEQMIRPGQDGALTWALPIAENSKFPLIDIKSDTGKFVKAIIKNRSSVLGARVLGAENYYTATQVLDTLAKVTGKKTGFVRLDEGTYKSFLPEFMAQEMLENHLFIENPGYYGGEDLEKSHAILDEKLVSLEEFLEKSSFKA